jgi:RNA polymerase sigma factor (sigma-70 family)
VPSGAFLEGILFNAPGTAKPNEFSPAELVVYGRELENWLRPLSSEQRRAVELRMQDFTLEEIADQLGRTERTIRRWLQRVRQQWKAEATAD